MTKNLFFSSSFFHQPQDELKYFKLITWPLEGKQHSELIVTGRWSEPIFSAVQIFLPPFLVQAPNKFTILRWWPMWIRIFSSVISALYSLAVAPSVNAKYSQCEMERSWPCWALSLLSTFCCKNLHYWMYFMCWCSLSIPLCSASSYLQ